MVMGMKDKLYKPKVFAGTSLGHFANDGTLLVFAILMVYYIKLPNISLYVLGIAAIIYQLISGYFSTKVGNYADHYSKPGYLISFGIILEGLAIFLFGVSFYLGPMVYLGIFISAIILGVGQSFYHPIGGSMLSQNFGAKSPKYMGMNGGFGSLGRALVPSIIAFSILYLGNFYGLSALSILYFVIAFLIFILLMKVTSANSDDDIKRSDKSEELPIKDENFGNYSMSVYKLTGVSFLKSVFVMGVITFIAVYLEDMIHLTDILTGEFMTLTFLFAIAGQYFFGWFITKSSSKKALVYSSIISVLAFGVFLATKNIAVSILSYSLFTFAALSTFPVLMSYSSDIVPKAYNNYSNSIVWGIGTIIGGAFGVSLITILIYFKVSIYFGMVSAFIVGLLSLASLVLLPDTKVK